MFKLKLTTSNWRQNTEKNGTLKESTKQQNRICSWLGLIEPDHGQTTIEMSTLFLLVVFNLKEWKSAKKSVKFV